MASICDKCTHLWRCNGKKYCHQPIHLPQGSTCVYSKTKKGCPCYEEGDNINKWQKKSNSGWARKGKK